MKSGVRSASRAGNYESPNISLSNSISIAGMDIVKRAVFLGRYVIRMYAYMYILAQSSKSSELQHRYHPCSHLHLRLSEAVGKS